MFFFFFPSILVLNIQLFCSFFLFFLIYWKSMSGHAHSRLLKQCRTFFFSVTNAPKKLCEASTQISAETIREATDFFSFFFSLFFFFFCLKILYSVIYIQQNHPFTIIFHFFFFKKRTTWYTPILRVQEEKIEPYKASVRERERVSHTSFPVLSFAVFGRGRADEKSSSSRSTHALSFRCPTVK